MKAKTVSTRGNAGRFWWCAFLAATCLTNGLQKGTAAEPAEGLQIPNCSSNLTDLTSWWPMDVDGTNRAGESSIAFSSQMSFVPAEVNQGAFFNGSGAFGVVPASSVINVGNGPGFTLELWITPFDLVNPMTIAEWSGETSNLGVHFYTSTSSSSGVGSLYANLIDIWGQSHSLVSPSGILKSNQLQHAALTYDRGSGTATIYLNGTNVAQAYIGGAALETSGNLYFGKRVIGASPYFFLGVMDEVGLFSRALNASEIRQIVLARTAGKCGVESPVRQCVAMPSGLVGWWRGEMSGDDSAGANAAGSRNGAGFSTGVVGTGFAFDGYDDYFLVNDAANLDLTNELTIELWFKGVDWNGRPLIDKRSGNLANYGVILDNNYGIEFYYNDPLVNSGDYPGSGFEIFSVRPLPSLGVFHHFAGTMRQAASNKIEMAVYIDGQLRRQTNYLGNLKRTVNSGALGIGTEGGGAGAKFNGVIDEVSIYNRALSGAEILAIFEAGALGKCAATVGPLIVTQPADLAVFEGQTASFTTAVQRPGDANFQWFRNSEPLPGATNTTLVLENVNASQAGGYFMVAAGGSGSVTSRVALLTVRMHLPCVPGPQGLVGWWKGEGSGEDAVGMNTASARNGAGYSSGMIGRGFSFDGGDDYFLVNDNTSLDLTNELTIELWFKGTDWNGRPLLDKRSWDAANYGVILDSTYGIEFYYNDPTVQSGDYPSSGFEIMAVRPLPSLGDFHHFAGTMRQISSNRVEMSVYIDGQLKRSTNFAGNLMRTVNNGALGIGTEGGGAGAKFNGVIDEVSIYNRALGAAEIQSIYLAEANGKCVLPATPMIVSQPASQEVFEGQTATFKAVVERASAATFQWYWNTEVLSGATNTTLVLENVNTNQIGSYSMVATSPVGSVTSVVATLVVKVKGPEGTFALGQSFSLASNPNGPWVYGCASSLTGEVLPLPVSYVTAAENGTPVSVWSLSRYESPAVFHNGSGGTAISDDGQGTFPPGSTWFYAGPEGKPYNYAVIRFRAPEHANGMAFVEVRVKPYLTGSRSGDTDFHINKNSIEVFGKSLAADAPALIYTNTLVVRAGDTLDFLIGRGQDGRLFGSGLMIDANIRMLQDTAAAPNILVQPKDLRILENRSAQFSVLAESLEVPTFQWQFNGVDIIGATNSTVYFGSAGPNQAGLYRVIVSNTSGSVISSNAALQVDPIIKPNIFDVSTDFSSVANPAGPWSFGYLDRVGGTFGTLGAFRVFSSDNGMPLAAWELETYKLPVVIKNVGGGTAISSGGQFDAPAGMVYFAPGFDNSPENLGVIRFTMPLGSDGQYRIETFVESLFSGQRSQDADFHVVVNGTEPFGAPVPPNSKAGYTNSLYIEAGGTIDFAVGRGPDGLVHDTGLKIMARLVSIVTNTVPGSCQEPPAGLVAWWGFDKNPGDLIGQSPLILMGEPAYQDGVVDDGLSFDGINDHARAEKSTLLNVGAGEGLSIEGWINPTRLSQLSPLVEWNDGTIGTHFWVSVQTPQSGGAGNLYANLIDTDGQAHLIYSQDRVLETNVYQHVALTYDRTNGLATIFLNGYVVAQTNLGSFHPLTSSDCYLGYRPYGPFSGLRFAGIMDEMSIYNRALNISEIRGIYTAAQRGKCKNAVAPVVINSPETLTVIEGNAARFNVAATGTSPMHYTWYHNGQEIAGNDSYSLIISNTQQSASGEYWVVIGNSLGMATSAVAKLTVVESQKNLVRNGSFELGSDPGNTVTLSAPNTNDITGWFLSAGSVDYISSRWPAANGQRSLDLNGTQAGTIEQTIFGLIPGKAYRLSFWMAANPEGSTTTRTVRVDYGNQSTNFVFTFNGQSLANMGWSLRQLVFRASNSSLLLKLSSLTPGIYGPALDNVAIEPLDNVIDPPVIAGQPQGDVVVAGATVTFAVTATGVQPITYQWLFNGSALSGATNRTLTVRNVQAVNAGNYTVEVSNPGGTVASAAAALVVQTQNLPPAFIAESGSLVVPPGTNAEFWVTASGSGLLRYQWFFNGEVVPAATNSTLTITNAQYVNVGVYTVIVANNNGSVTNRGMILNVTDVTVGGSVVMVNSSQNPIFDVDGVTLLRGSAYVAQLFAGPTATNLQPVGLPAPFSVLNVGKFNGGARIVANIAPNQTGFAQVRVWESAFGRSYEEAMAAGGKTGASIVFSQMTGEIIPAILETFPSFALKREQNVPAPEIVTEPIGQTVSLGAPVTFSVEAEGIAPLIYQWKLNGNEVAGANGASFTIGGVTMANAGDYTVVVSNGGGSITSAVAVLTVDIARTLLVTGPAEPQEEGAKITLPLNLISQGEVAGMAFVLHYNPDYLSMPVVLWGGSVTQALTQAHTPVAGQLRGVFVFGNGTVAAGTQMVAQIEFRARTVSEQAQSELRLEIVDVSNVNGEPLAYGNQAIGTTVAITGGGTDNNGNDRIDVGDATLLLRLITRFDTTRPWDVARNDLNHNGQLDSGDAIKLLQAAAASTNLPPEIASEIMPAEVTPSVPTGNVVLSPARLRGSAGQLVTYQVRLENVAHPVAAATFTLNYPASALRVATTRAPRLGSMVPAQALAVWNTDTAGQLRLVVSAPQAWSANNGVLAEVTFEVLPEAATQMTWSLGLRGVEITEDGFAPRGIPGSRAVFIGRSPLAGTFTGLERQASGEFRFQTRGEAGADYVIEYSDDLRTWHLLRNFSATADALSVSDPDAAGKPMRFYRTRPVE